MRKIISLICFLLPVLACADQLQIRPDAGTGASADVSPDAPPKVIPEVRPDAPDQYTVVRGDTLWDISGKFFKDPWKWPYIWGLNKDTIKDPHWIYPGDVVRLDRASGTLRIGQVDAGKPAVADATDTRRDTSDTSDVGDTIRLSPKVHIAPSAHDAIPSIPANVLGPFLSQPLVIEEEALKGAPEMIGAREGRVVLGDHDIAFAKGLIPDMGDKWQIYRPGKKLIDPETEEMLGIEAVYLGNAEVNKFAEVSTISITRSVQEIHKGDNLLAYSDAVLEPYLPRAPEADISARVISIYGGVSQAGQNAAIVLNKGARDGLEVGHVLALYRKGEVVRESGRFIFSRNKVYTLPDERYGLVFVFRVFNKVSYALVMQTKLPVQLLDRALIP